MENILRYLPWTILAFLLLAIIFLKAKLVLLIDSSVTIKLRIMMFSFTLIGNKKRKRPKKRDYTKKSLERRQKRAQRALEKKRAKRSRKNSESSKKNEFSFKFPEDVEKLLDTLSSLFSDLLLPIIKNSRIRFKYFRVTVASSDPADTAIRYGVISQSVAYFLHILCENSKLSDRQLSKVRVESDFIAERSSLSLHMTASFGLWRLILTVIKGGLKVMKKLAKLRRPKNKSNDHKFT